MTWLIALLGLVATGLGGWLAVDPASSPASHFPPLNEHLIHDSAAVFLAFGLGLLLAARVPDYRFPILALAALWNGLHTVSHIVDVNSAATRAQGVTAIVELAALTVALAVLAWRSAPDRSARRA
jgi:predicted anti-sigma-YlaC factor YlaD